jgi:hypothetical protein
MGIEPTTYSLGSCRSTTELRPRADKHSEGCRSAASAVVMAALVAAIHVLSGCER